MTFQNIDMENEVVKQSGELQIGREEILGFQEFLSTVPGVFYGDSENCPLKHTFAPGVYVREILIPRGMFVVGKIHKHAHPNFLMKGEVTVITESGGRERLKAPLSMISPPGTKRVVFAHEDTVWITIHPTGETDLAKIEEHVIAKSFEEYEDFKRLEESTKKGELL